MLERSELELLVKILPDHLVGEYMKIDLAKPQAEVEVAYKMDPELLVRMSVAGTNAMVDVAEKMSRLMDDVDTEADNVEEVIMQQAIVSICALYKSALAVEGYDQYVQLMTEEMAKLGANYSKMAEIIESFERYLAEKGVMR